MGQVASVLGAQVRAKARGLSAHPVSTAVRISQKMPESCWSGDRARHTEQFTDGLSPSLVLLDGLVFTVYAVRVA